jgi:hypothetical protein
MIKKLCALRPEIKARADNVFWKKKINSADSHLEKKKIGADSHLENLNKSALKENKSAMINNESAMKENKSAMINN